VGPTSGLNRCGKSRHHLDSLGWTVRGSNTGGEEIFSHPYRPASCTMGTWSFPEVKRPGCTFVNPPPSTPRSKKEWSYTCILHLRAFVAFSRVNFTFTFTVNYMATKGAKAVQFRKEFLFKPSRCSLVQQIYVIQNRLPPSKYT
jgi:hypothetical protein